MLLHVFLQMATLCLHCVEFISFLCNCCYQRTIYISCDAAPSLGNNQTLYNKKDCHLLKALGTYLRVECSVQTLCALFTSTIYHILFPVKTVMICSKPSQTTLVFVSYYVFIIIIIISVRVKITELLLCRNTENT